MTDIARIPTLDDIYESKDAMDDIQSFTYDSVDSFIDANEVTRDTVTGRIKKMGYAVPIAYAGAIVFAANDNVKTVEESGVVYAPLPSALPFTTSGTFVGDDDTRFFVVQGILLTELESRSFNTLADWQNELDLNQGGGQQITLAERSLGNNGGSKGAVITGIGTANGYERIAHNTLSLTLVIDINSVLDVTKIGAIGDNSFDNGDTIRHAKSLTKSLYFPYTGLSYNYTGVLYMDAKDGWFSSIGDMVVLKKTDNAVGSGTNVKPGGVGSDSYVKDACLIIRHPDNSYATNVNYENITFEAGSDNDYVVYAPRIFNCSFTNGVLKMNDGLYGYVTHNTFMTRFTDIQPIAINNNIAGSIGFWWDDEATGASGTSCIFTRCWVRDGVETSYKIRGLVYSSIIGCGTDKFVETALDLDLCDISIDSFGFENRTSGAGDALKFTASRISIDSLVGFSVHVDTANHLINVNGGDVVIDNIRHTSSASTGKSLKISNSGKIQINGVAAYGTGIVNTPTIDSTSKLINLDTLPTAYDSGPWTPVIRGSGTAGTYELSATNARYTRFGNIVTLHANLTLDSPITGGGTIALNITGIPFQKLNDGTIPCGTCILGGVDYTNGALITVSFNTGGATSTLRFAETSDNGAVSNIPISGLSANDTIALSITYETDNA